MLYDPGYTANPLVYAGCIGVADTAPPLPGPHPGDLVVVMGGRTGRDGLRGATFSSATMDATTGDVAGASVQIGDPIVEKLVIDAMRDLHGLYTAVTDCGAGGLSSAVGEMAEGVGADVDVTLAPLKYPGLRPWEVWLSEAQERMVFAVPPAHWSAVLAVCARHGVEAHSLGVLGERGRGLAEAAGVEEAVDFVVGTFSKSLGSIGGYCVSNHAQLEAIRFSIRSYIFTASPSPAVIASTCVALRLMQERPQLRAQLWHNAERLYAGLQGLGFTLGPQASPVVAVRIEDRETALRWWPQLLEQGIYVNLVVPPASPSAFSLLRCSVSAAHSDDQVDRIIAAFATLRTGA